jgi:hypothetical protein
MVGYMKEYGYSKTSRETMRLLDANIPWSERRRFCAELAAVRRAVCNDVVMISVLLSDAEPYLRDAASRTYGVATHWMIASALNGCHIKNLSALSAVRLDVVTPVLEQHKSLATIVQDRYPEHPPGPMARLLRLLWMERNEFSSFGDVLSFVDEHPGISTDSFAKGVLMLARSSETPVLEVLCELAKSPDTCEMVLMLAVADTPGSVRELQDVVDAIQ